MNVLDESEWIPIVSILEGSNYGVVLTVYSIRVAKDATTRDANTVGQVQSEYNNSNTRGQ